MEKHATDSADSQINLNKNRRLDFIGEARRATGKKAGTR
jgi:hypothetical protein